VALLIGVAMLLLASALAWLPKSVLAATIIVAVLAGVSPRPFLDAWRYDRAEGALMLAVSATVLLWSMTAGLALGVLCAIALLLKRAAMPQVTVIGRIAGTEHYRAAARHQVEQQHGVLGLRIDESLVFTNARHLSDVVQALLDGHPGCKRVVLNMAPVNAVDYSGLEALRDLHALLLRQQVRMDIAEIKGPVLEQLRGGDFDLWFAGQVFLSHHQGVSKT
ncbi:MAG TPA: STAS domain-containing protein, partial [Burkholderiaceae bacterium]